MIIVWCGSMRQFDVWCHDNYVNRKHTDIRPIYDLHSAERCLHGQINPIVLRWGTWYESKDTNQIEILIQSHTK